MSTKTAPMVGAIPASRPTLRDRLNHLDVKASPYLYISPFFILFLVVGLYPLLYTSWVSVHDWHLIGGQGEFVGMQNFVEVVGRERFSRALVNTFSIFLLSSIPQVAVAIAIAAVLDANIRTKTFWRMGVLLPYVVAPVAVSLIFAKLFADQSGMINAILGNLGAGPIRWHADRFASHVAIATMVGFRWTGFNALIFLAAMQAVPRDLYEAALIDGAGRVRQFFSVTVPMVRATIIFVVITATISGLQIFDEPRMYDTIGRGGSDRQWMTMTLYLYELGWGSQKSFGRAAAVAWILFLIILAIALVNLTITRRIASVGTSDRKRRARKEVAR
ncbi:MAG: carbohydrate ABC transporter permease [Actinomycetota bacterium]